MIRPDGIEDLIPTVDGKPKLEYNDKEDDKYLLSNIMLNIVRRAAGLPIKHIRL